MLLRLPNSEGVWTGSCLPMKGHEELLSIHRDPEIDPHLAKTVQIHRR